MLEAHAQRGHDTSISIRPASAASEEACFSFGRLKSHLPKRTRNLAQNRRLWQQLQMGDSRKNQPIRGPPPPPPPLITPSSLCEVMNEAPSRGAFVFHHSVTLFPEVAGAVVGGEGGLTEAGIDPPNWACAAMPRPARTKPPSSRNP